MTKHLNRRIFLRGLGGAVVAAPFLGSLAGRHARAQSVPAFPKRLIVMFTHLGCVTERFFPGKSHGPLVASDLESTTLAPLVPFLRKLLIPRGIRAMNEWTSTLSRGQGNDPHLQASGSYFTCQRARREGRRRRISGQERHGRSDQVRHVRQDPGLRSRRDQPARDSSAGRVRSTQSERLRLTARAPAGARNRGSRRGDAAHPTSQLRTYHPSE